MSIDTFSVQKANYCLRIMTVKTHNQSRGQASFFNGRKKRNDRRIGGASGIFLNLFLCMFLFLDIPETAAALDEVPSALPVSEQPSLQPSGRNASYSPSTSLPTGLPTTTSLPSLAPSSSFGPSKLPSAFPTPEPTFDVPLVARAMFRQRFVVENGREFLRSEIGFIESLYIGSTADFSDETNVELKVETKCNVTAQVGGPPPPTMPPTGMTRYRMRGRVLQQWYEFVDVDYEMTYTSIYINVTDYPLSFQTYVNKNNETIVKKMITLGLNVSEAQTPQRFVLPPATAAPGPVPTLMPTAAPSMTSFPSRLPSWPPTGNPTLSPSQSFLPTNAEPSQADGPATETIVIVVSAIIAGSIVFIGFLIYYRKRSFERERNFQSDAAGRSPEGIWNPGAHPKPFSTLGTKNGNEQTLAMNPDGMISPSESLISNQSLLSAGNPIGGDSGDEADATHGLADEFDQYKDPIFEKMRADIEGNLTGFDSMMSQALTRALIDEDDDNIDPTEILWGGSGKLTGAEIEASALGEVADWMKRKENATVEEK